MLKGKWSNAALGMLLKMSFVVWTMHCKQLKRLNRCTCPDWWTPRKLLAAQGSYIRLLGRLGLRCTIITAGHFRMQAVSDLSKHQQDPGSGGGGVPSTAS